MFRDLKKLLSAITGATPFGDVLGPAGAAAAALFCSMWFTTWYTIHCESVRAANFAEKTQEEYKEFVEQGAREYEARRNSPQIAHKAD